MALSALITLIIIIIAIIEICFFPIPVGSDKAKSRRVPFITLALVCLNVIIFAATFKIADEDSTKLDAIYLKLARFLETNPGLLGSETVQKKLREAGLAENDEIILTESVAPLKKGDDQETIRRFGKEDYLQLMKVFDGLIDDFDRTYKDSFHYKYGLGPNGKWHFSQLITHMFLHGDFLHILGNMIFLLALGSGLEEYWGHKVYSLFYILVGMAACVPSFVVPYSSPMVGASGAISGVMGAFLICMHNTKVKVGWVSIPFFPIFLIIGKKPFGIIRMPAYIYMGYYFLTQLLFWWIAKKFGSATNVAHSAHVGGFFFGVAFAILWESAREARRMYTGKIDIEPEEPAVLQVNPVVTEAMSLLQQGNAARAEQLLRDHIGRNNNDVRAIRAILRVFQHTGDYAQFKDTSLWLIGYTLATGDTESAVHTYRNLCMTVHRDGVELHLPAPDWTRLCESLRKAGMHKEAVLEFEMLALTYPDTMIAIKACVQGGETALSINDTARAAKLFEMALAKSTSNAFEERARRGLEACRNLSTAQPSEEALSPAH